MSVSLSVDGMNKEISIEEFKIFLEKAVKKWLNEDCHKLTFKQEGDNQLWVACESGSSRGCWFSFHKNSVNSTTYSGRSQKDMAIQDVAVHVLVLEYGGNVFDPQGFSIEWFDKKARKWMFQQFDPFES